MSPRRWRDLTGLRFGMLVAQKRVGYWNEVSRWECLCDCGRTIVMAFSNLRTNRSCGCKQHIGRHKTHGLTRTPIYAVWRNMIHRCTKSTNHAWKHYGGRGITVCERWLDIKNFLADMGTPPLGKTLERINNDLGYSPDNCKWASLREQARNRRNIRLITFNGKTQCLRDWANELGISHGALGYRLARCSVEVAFTSPKQPSGPLLSTRSVEKGILANE